MVNKYKINYISQRTGNIQKKPNYMLHINSFLKKKTKGEKASCLPAPSVHWAWSGWSQGQHPRRRYRSRIFHINS